MKILFVRHGESVDDIVDRYGGSYQDYQRANYVFYNKMLGIEESNYVIFLLGFLVGSSEVLH